MPRNFRFYVKKRGGRRTDSTQLGNLALALFFGLFFLAGTAFLVFLLSTLVIPEWRVNHRFVEGRCVVVSKRLLERGRSQRNAYYPEMRVVYNVGDVEFQAGTYDITRSYSADKDSQQAVLARFDEGKAYPCWYDPDDPATVVLVRGYTWSGWLLLLLPFSFMVAGGGGLALTLLNWGKSAERRAMLSQRTIGFDFFELTNDAGREYPTVPRANSLADSQGTTLAIRLPVDAKRAWTLVTLAAVSCGVLAIASIFVVIALNGHLAGRPDWFMSIFAGSWLVVGLAGLGFCMYQALRGSGLGPTLLEISDHPLRPGEPYEVFLSQSGRTSFKSLELLLVCEEKATYQQGTNTRAESCRVYQQRVLDQADLSLRHPTSFEARSRLTVPPHMMHSFVSEHNEIRWSLIVSAAADEGPELERRFPIIVCPPRDQSPRA